MPLYEYRCSDCRKRFSLLVGVVAEREAEACPGCGGANINRLISRFSRMKSDEDLIDALADPSKTGDLDDPGELRNWMKMVGREMGEDLGDDFGDMLDEAMDDDSPVDLDAE